MALNNGINIRLSPDIRDRLERLAMRYGIKSSVLIRQAIIEKLDDVEHQAKVVISATGHSAQAAGRDLVVSHQKPRGKKK